MSDQVPTRGLRFGLLGFFGSIVSLIVSWITLSVLTDVAFGEGLAIAIGLVMLIAFGASATFSGFMVAAWTHDYGSDWLKGE